MKLVKHHHRAALMPNAKEIEVVMKFAKSKLQIIEKELAQDKSGSILSEADQKRKAKSL